MKKIFYFLLVLMYTVNSQAQKIKIDTEIDKFTKAKRVQTNYITLKMELTRGYAAKLRSVGDSYYITFRGAIGVGVVGPDDATIFLLDNDSTIKVYPTSIQSYEIDVKYGNYYTHQYKILEEDLVQLSQHDLKSIRRYYDDHYTDIDLNDKRKDSMKELAIKFLEEIKK